MAVYIIKRHMEGGSEHRHIAKVMWEEKVGSKTDTSTTAQMVDWIRNKGGEAFVKDSSNREVAVGWVDETPPYLRTHADGVPTDNLLSLPEF